MADEYLLLKWGSLKGWSLGDNEAARAAAERFASEGMSMSAALQHNTDTQREALCDLIDAINGPITNDWSGEEYTKDQAKAYIREYRQ